MSPPDVYIEKEPFLNMILASIETFKRECFGIIFGTVPSGQKNYFVITNAIAIQLAKKRKNSEVEQSSGSQNRIDEIFDKYPYVYRSLGDFHSHPEWGDVKGATTLSDVDIKDMIERKIRLGVLIKISSINKERIIWQQAQGGGIKGSLGRYKFHINVIRLVRDKKQQCLKIHAPDAVKALNRSLGYQ